MVYYTYTNHYKEDLIMSEKDVQDYLTSGLYGAPQTKPEERNKFLGNLRERVYVSMTPEELVSKNYLTALQTEMEQHPDAQLLLNGSIDSSEFSPYIKLCNQQTTQFTIVTNQFASKSPFALLLVAKEAVDSAVIDIAEKYPVTETPVEEPEKKSLLKRLFS